MYRVIHIPGMKPMVMDGNILTTKTVRDIRKEGCKRIENLTRKEGNVTTMTYMDFEEWCNTESDSADRDEDFINKEE